MFTDRHSHWLLFVGTDIHLAILSTALELLQQAAEDDDVKDWLTHTDAGTGVSAVFSSRRHYQTKQIIMTYEMYSTRWCILQVSEIPDRQSTDDQSSSHDSS